MEILPSEYKNLELSRSEKVFTSYIKANNDCFGNFLLNVNPAMLENEYMKNMHLLLTEEGIVVFKFFNDVSDPDQFAKYMSFYVNIIHKKTADNITKKLISNKALIGPDGKLKFPVAIVYVCPLFEKKDIKIAQDSEMRSFFEDNCLFKSDLPKVRNSLEELVHHYCAYPISPLSEERMGICEKNINSILQRIAPEYVTIRVSKVVDEKTSAGADAEALVVTEDDLAVKAYRLDEDQINIVNKMTKGEQLILACAGSGKSVLLIAKCFKAAKMNSDKQFVITCYNKNLQSLYTWFIDRAGFKEKNVICLTFYALCKKLLQDNRLPVRIGGAEKYDIWVQDVIARLNAGQIKQRFYGIFIDEIQQFSTEWYKLSFNLVENKDSKDHIFVICGDQTQKIKSKQKHGKAPWNAGEGYPNYRGGNKSIRIEKNYRNCIEINEYINNYVLCAKRYLKTISPDIEIDPDVFLRGKSSFHGHGVILKKLREKSNWEEANVVYKSICHIHDSLGIPYDEIAVLMYNAKYNAKFGKSLAGWKDREYKFEETLEKILNKNDIPISYMYNVKDNWRENYGDGSGIRMVKFGSVLGLDFRAVIICGLLPLGVHDETKNPDWEKIQKEEKEFDEKLEATQECIRNLYVACSRAKEVLHIILPESGDSSVYIKMLEDSKNAEGIV